MLVVYLKDKQSILVLVKFQYDTKYPKNKSHMNGFYGFYWLDFLTSTIAIFTVFLLVDKRGDHLIYRWACI